MLAQVILLVNKYPQFKIVNFDKLDYCSCIEVMNTVLALSLLVF